LVFSKLALWIVSDDVYIRKELVNGTGDPTLQSLGGKLALQAGTAKTDFDCIALNADQFHRTMMKLLDVSADLLNQASDLFFSGIIRGNMVCHIKLLKADMLILSCLNGDIV